MIHWTHLCLETCSHATKQPLATPLGVDWWWAVALAIRVHAVRVELDSLWWVETDIDGHPTVLAFRDGLSKGCWLWGDGRWEARWVGHHGFMARRECCTRGITPNWIHMWTMRRTGRQPVVACRGQAVSLYWPSLVEVGCWLAGDRSRGWRWRLVLAHGIGLIGGGGCICTIAVSLLYAPRVGGLNDRGITDCPAVRHRWPRGSRNPKFMSNMVLLVELVGHEIVRSNRWWWRLD